ncbi:DEAD/DEAH box helicase [Microbacterium sp. zg.Y1090]|uniref:DEAD/DEAH box helicase n=1 Tax=Microbacterium TaxID=33882 RepID=UPI00214C5F6A|nr:MULTISPECIES: DEAD/DEAH box helicase [unclassified Microbacterium]MCR2812313.1 DEAD/DEAH box helicase [Microbacterium sp. zg.Y1084]MCR2819797.1 DEAD/DEAH box helicase [Microbacterium sp. zg.Y1090]MDL5485470.1 DEAD/DEAH box helicase [Microbacterium sp. zg-Y1211]WIM28645.1 DEAD/DEAH box helicase [Microbacterium sp. zg-Y1090]
MSSSFLSLGVPEKLAAVLAAEGKTDAFAIQRDTLPDSLAGRDVLGRGRTGSGKTIAFSLPLVARLSGAGAAARRPGRPRGLVLAPTRELATQIAATISPLAAAVGLNVTTVFGGVSQRGQEQAFARGVDIVVACPGRLEDLMKQKVVDLSFVEIVVLDEADHMADLGFLPGVTRILSATPAGGQRMLFSATLDRGVDTLVRKFLRDEVRHEVDESSVPQGVMTHRVFVVPGADEKTALVRQLASGQGRRILFTRTKHQAKKLAKQLTASGIPAVDLHGNLSQGARDRNLASFGADTAKGGVRVLVATDVAARGVHVDDVELVVHVDPPVEHKAYLHRSGRTARAGAEGVVVTVALDAQRGEVKDLLRKAKVSAALEPVAAGASAVSVLVGEPAAHVTPAPVTAAPQRSGGGGRNGGSGRGAGNGGGRSGGSASGGRSGGSGRGAGTGRGRDGQGSGAARTASAPAAASSRSSRPARPTTGATVADIRANAGTGRGRGSRRAHG